MTGRNAQPTEPNQLLERIADEDKAAFNEFYQAFGPRVYNFALSRLDDPDAAGDILNETMLEVWCRAGTFQGRSKVSTWVLGIAHHKVIDRLRKEKRQAHDELDEQVPDEGSATAEELLSEMDDTRQLQDCMKELSDAHRLVIHLAFFEDLPYADIARIAQCPVGTVKTRMLHAKAALKRCLMRSRWSDDKR